MTDFLQYVSKQVQLNDNHSASQVQTNHIADAQITSLQNALDQRYHIIKQLGKGSQGSVFLAVSRQTHQKVAIKQLHISSVKDWKQYDLFQREANVLKRLDIHGVAKLHETIEILDTETPVALIVQEYIEGSPMQEFIAQGHRFQIEQIGDIMIQLLDILKQLHQSYPQVIHRDIKPSNILLNYRKDNPYPEVHLIDFGAVANPQVKGGGSTVVGTYGYMAPEQLMGRASAASDLYSLAIVSVYLLSGVPPENLEIQDYRILIDSHLEHLPYPVTAFLRNMLEPEVENRMTDYKQIHTFFQAIKQQCFNDIPQSDSAVINRKYSLKNVKSYHQAGNIVLWQELEDSTPRHLPKQLKRTYLRQCLLSPQVLTFAGLSIFITIWAIMLTTSGNSSKVSLILEYMMLAVFIITDFIVLMVAIHTQIIPKAQISYFVKNARKSMATVIRIEYQSCYESNKTNHQLLTNTFTPTWLITYSFNPPDDASPDALIKTVKTHVKPNIHEGDLIPILYLIHNSKVNFNHESQNGFQDDSDDNKLEYVYSTPYPVPAKDELMPSED